MNRSCFVIQPFDNNVFDSRYKEIIKPAISKSGLIPYRVDEDLSISIIIDGIEQGIRNCDLCIAEITTDNPNVWYELGYAFACNKPVIMLCSDERSTSYPFDIRHRMILSYKTKLPSDYENLKNTLINKITALSISKRTYSELEILILNTIMIHQNTPQELTPQSKIIHNSNATKDEIIRAIHKLINDSLVEYVYSRDKVSSSYYRLTPQGNYWFRTQLESADISVTP